MSVVASHIAPIDKDALDRLLTWQDRLSIFRRLGFSIPEKKVKAEGWIDGLRLPPSIHHDTKAGASVDLRTGGVKDHGGSGYSANFFQFVQAARGCTFQEALEWIADATGHSTAARRSTNGTRRKRPPQRTRAKITPIHTNGSAKADSAPKWHPLRDGVEAAAFPYTDQHGKPCEVVRFEVCADHPAHPDKTFLQRRYAPTDAKADDRGYAWGLDGASLLPFRLPLVLEAIDDGEPVFICEGEKAVMAVERLGLVATCNSGGALSWKDEHSAHFEGADVVILPDNDPLGREHADAVAASLSGIAQSIKIVELPGLPEKGDAHEYVEGGGTVRALMQLVEAAPLYQAAPEPFWYEETTKQGSVVLKVNQAHLVAFLESYGFGKFYLTGARQSIFVRVEDRVVEEVSAEQIKDFTLAYIATSEHIDETDRERVLACLIRGANIYFSKYLLTCMAPLDLAFQRDTREAGCVFYENGFAEVQADLITFHAYHDLSGYVWRNAIQARRLQLIPGFDGSKFGEGDFGKFLWNVCGPKRKELTQEQKQEQRQRFRALFTAMGYLIHGYKDVSQARAVCFIDEKYSDGDALEGRGGKGLVFRAVGHVVPTLHIDARSFRFGEQFSWQLLRPGTRFVHFDDANKRFPFERLYSVITGDMQTEQKNRDQRTIPFAESPKFGISTNYVIDGEGGSHEDRIVEIEFSDYYSARHKPVDDFGRRFFDEWDAGEWNHFDNLMLTALRSYLALGLVSYEHVNLAARKLQQKTAPEFLVWAEELEIGKDHNKKELHQDFIAQYPDFADGKSKVAQRTITGWLRSFAASCGLEVEEWKSSNERYLKLIKPPET